MKRDDLADLYINLCYKYEEENSVECGSKTATQDLINMSHKIRSGKMTHHDIKLIEHVFEYGEMDAYQLFNDFHIRTGKAGVILLGLVSITAIFTAIAHLSCIVLGERCYRAQLAPDWIVQSAIDVSLLAPIATVFASLLFLVCAAYALSAAKLLPHLPFLTTASYIISAMCILRGVMTIPSAVTNSHMVNEFFILSGVVWFIAGILFLLGIRTVSSSDK